MAEFNFFMRSFSFGIVLDLTPETIRYLFCTILKRAGTIGRSPPRTESYICVQVPTGNAGGITDF